MSLGETIELSLALALRHELGGWSEKDTITALGKTDPDAAVVRARFHLHGLPQDTLLGANAASVFLGKCTRSLRTYENEDPVVFGPDIRVGEHGEKRYSVGRLHKMRDALDDRVERSLERAQQRRESRAARGRVVEKTYPSMDDLNRDIAAGLTSDGTIVNIVLSIRIAAFGDVVADHFVVDGIHDLLTTYLWEDPDLQLMWQTAYRVVAGEMLTDGLVEAHAASSSARLRRVFEGPAEA